MNADPFAILAQVLPRARSEEELVQMAAQLGPPPPADFAPPGITVPRGGVARLQGMPASPLVPGGGMNPMVPPMKTRSEYQTSPSIGQHLTGKY